MCRASPRIPSTLDWRSGICGYRRFIAVTALAAIRQEDPAVFERSHTEIARWFAEGLADGVPEEAATAIATIPAPQDFAGSESQALPPRKGPDAAVIRSRIACAGTDSDRYVAAAAATWAAAR